MGRTNGEADIDALTLAGGTVEQDTVVELGLGSHLPDEFMLLGHVCNLLHPRIRKYVCL